MKIKYLLPILLVALLPIKSMATDEKSLEYCDNRIYDTVFSRFGHRDDNATTLTYMLGTREDKSKFKFEVLEFCEQYDCAVARNSSRILVGDEYSVSLNMVALPFMFNNKEISETLILNKPELTFLTDSGIYPEKPRFSNGEYMTPALNAIREGQPGILKYLISKYNVNLRKKAGYIYYGVSPDKSQLDGLRIAEKALEKWKNETPDRSRARCAEEVLSIVRDWYDRTEHNQEIINDAKAYNDKLYEIASNNIVENIIPFEFVPSLDLFKIQNIEENFAINIDKKIDALIEKIMRDFDFSSIGNQA